MAKIIVKITGERETRKLVKEAAGIPKKINNEMYQTVLELRNLWRLNMPHDTGFLKESVFAGIVGKGKARASTMTFLKKQKGYTIFPEKANDGKAYTRPHYTKKTVEEFAKKWGNKTIKEIDDIIG